MKRAILYLLILCLTQSCRCELSLFRHFITSHMLLPSKNMPFGIYTYYYSLKISKFPYQIKDYIIALVLLLFYLFVSRMAQIMDVHTYENCLNS